MLFKYKSTEEEYITSYMEPALGWRYAPIKYKEGV